MISNLTILIWIILALCRGSLLGVIVSRTADNNTWKIWRSIIIGRSYCDIGKHPLQRYQLIPIVGYLIQKGKCNQCRTKIALTSTWIELSSVIAFLFVYYLDTNRLQIWYRLVMWSSLIIIAFVDIYNQTLHIPSRIVLVIIHSIILILYPHPLIGRSIIWGILIFVIMYQIAKYYAHHRYGMIEWLGQGDVMLAPILIMSLTRYRLINQQIIGKIDIISDIVYLLVGASIMGIIRYLTYTRQSSQQTLPFLPCMILWYALILILQNTR